MQRRAPLPTVLALWLAGLCAAAQFAKIGLVLPELGAVYPDAGIALGFLVSSVSVVGVLLGLVAGVLCGRLGPRRLLLGGLALGAATSLVQGFLPPLPVLLASRLVEGAAHLAIVVAAPTLIARVSTDALRPAAMSLWGTFFGVSFALTAWLGLPLVASGGPEALLFAHAALTAGVGAVVAFVLPRQAAADAHPAPGPRGLLDRHVHAWRSPRIAAPAVAWLFYTLTFVALLAVLPGLVAPDRRAFAATAMPLAGIAFSLTLGVLLLRRLEAVRVVGLGFALSIAAALVLAFVPDDPRAGIGLFAALGLVQGASFASIPQLNPAAHDQALANGALAQAGNLGNAVGTPLLLALHAAGGVAAMMAFVIACYVAAGVSLPVLAARRRALSGGRT